MEKKKRIKYIDLCKGLGILMVTWGHITNIGNPVDTWTSSFKMSIFFIAAGYLICYADSFRNLTLKIYGLKLLKSLGVPYVVFSIASIGFRCLSMIMKHSLDMASIKSYIFATVTLRGVFALWFLPVLLFAEILFFCIIKYFPKWTRVLVILIPPVAAVKMAYLIVQLKETLSPIMFERISFVLLPVGKVVVALWFLYIGYLGCKILTSIRSEYTLFAIGVLFTAVNLIVSQWNLRVDLNNMALGEKPVYFFLCGILGSFGALLIFQFLERYMKFTMLNYFGKNSLILMSTQRPFYLISIGTAGWRVISGAPGVLSMRYYVDCLGAMAIVLMLEYFVITFINEKAKFSLGRF